MHTRMSCKANLLEYPESVKPWEFKDFIKMFPKVAGKPSEYSFCSYFLTGPLGHNEPSYRAKDSAGINFGVSSKPYEHSLSTLKNLTHHLDLVAFFLFVILIDTHGVCPEYPCSCSPTKPLQSVHQVPRDVQ